ncbi:hypothetical protein [Weissella hellenica]|uniref:Uncharacterized protein n=2 Tax=Weissella hellenica TaxID=46256 RepID=A0A7X6LNV2_WEIHE|nr:hypothetical protein [Weissella hellenica]NKY67162.1 hypothetical protein [Weissella hellenica]
MNYKTQISRASTMQFGTKLLCGEISENKGIGKIAAAIAISILYQKIIGEKNFEYGRSDVLIWAAFGNLIADITEEIKNQRNQLLVGRKRGGAHVSNGAINLEP